MLYNTLISSILIPTTLILTTLIFTNCSSSPLAPTTITPVEFTELSLFLSRKSLSKTEFEQFTLNNKKELFVECGRIKGGRHLPIIQELGVISQNKYSEIQKSLTMAIQDKPLHSTTFESPGDNDSLFDPGKFIFNYSTKESKEEAKTSLDAIADADNKVELALLSLTSLIRKNSQTVAGNEPLCGNHSFYGIN